MTGPHLLSAEDPTATTAAVQVLQSEGTVVFPTDTVYGLGANAFNPTAIQKLFKIKGRAQNQAIAVLLGNVEQLSLMTEHLSPAAQALAEKHWPGALTLVVSRHPSAPEILSPLPTIGVRIPDHPVALALLQQSGPLAVTSANLSGEPNTTTAQQALSQLGTSVDLYLDGGETPGGVPSTVVDLTGNTPVVLRQGSVVI